MSTNSGIEEVNMYEYMYVVGKDRVEDFRNGQTEGDGYLRGLVKVAVDGGMDGRASYWENCKTHVKNQLHPTNILFSFSTNPFDLKGIGKNVKGTVRTRPKAPKIEISVATPKSAPSIKPQGWNEFQIGRKGMYTKENYGSTKAAQKARSRDYQRMKDKN
ncbi:hypothetical protein [Dysgonomonas sp. GY617]|uniref:hypothetical protein n=1 Tax=Dysgonomonas sp. GY617 TaxID=2780420 RepID=UPI0018846126|nr:hypothetical protein [Dysgonomonas sp. GY617]MBF0575566.1 hypothetical protein [Dysgonomonas sp. GY617]